MLALGGVRRIGSRIGAVEQVALFGTLRPDDPHHAPRARVTAAEHRDPVVPYAHAPPQHLFDGTTPEHAPSDPAPLDTTPYKTPRQPVGNSDGVRADSVAAATPPALPTLSHKTEQPAGTQWVPPRARTSGVPDEVMEVLPLLCVTLQLLILILLCIVIYMLRTPTVPHGCRRSKPRRRRRR